MRLVFKPNYRSSKMSQREPEGFVMGHSRVASNRSRKRPKGAPTHVARYHLDPTPHQVWIVLARVLAGNRIYNACLKEALRRLVRLGVDQRFSQAKAMSNGKVRTEAFCALGEDHGFSECQPISYVSSLCTSWSSPGRRTLVRIRRRMAAKAKTLSTELLGQKTENQSPPMAKAA